MFLDKLFRRKLRAKSLEEFVELARDGGYGTVRVQPAVIVKRGVNTAAVGPIGDHHHVVMLTATGSNKRKVVHTIHFDDIQRFGSSHGIGDLDKRRAVNVKHGLRTEQLMRRLRSVLSNATIEFVDTYGNVVNNPQPMFDELREWAEANGVAA